MNENRTPAGVPTGGQFAASARAEAAVNPWKSTDDEYMTETTRQTDWPIRPVEMQAAPRRAKGLVEMVDEGLLDLNPPYQRASVWTLDQRVNLIRSFLAKTPVPAVILNYRDRYTWRDLDHFNPGAQRPYAVIDGKQRIETMRAWYAREFGVPKSWFVEEDVEDSYETSDGPYVNYQGLSAVARRDFDQNALMPVAEAKMATLADEAETYVRVNTAGTAQSTTDMDNARAWADGSAEA